MKKANGIIFGQVDREDGWISGISFIVDTSGSYEDQYNLLKEKLESKEVVDYVIDDRCLVDDLFLAEYEDESFTFKKTRWEYGLVYVFENAEGEEAEYKFQQTDNIYIG